MARVIGSAYSAGVRLVERLVPRRELAERLTWAAVQAVARDADTVVLVPGFGNSQRIFDNMARSLRADGFRVIVTEQPRHGMASFEDAAAALDELIRPEVAAGRKVDVVTFSSGAVAARAMLRRTGGLGVDSLVLLAPPNQGAALSNLYGRILPEAWRPVSNAQLSRGSAYVRQLDEAGTPRHVRATVVATGHFDGFVGPRDVALEGARVVTLGREDGWWSRLGRNHLSIVTSDDDAYRATRAALLDGAAPS